MCVCCWLVPVLVGSASLQPRGRDADLVPAHWMCVCFGELLLLFLLFQLVMMTRWFFCFVGGGRSGGGSSSYSCLQLLSSSSSSKKTGKRVVFSIVDVTRLLAVRHKLIHAHTSSTRTQGRTHTHSRTHKRLECARVFDSSLCVWAFILFLLLFFSGYFMILSITLFFFFSLFYHLLFIPLLFISFLISYN